MRFGGLWIDIIAVAALTVALSFFRKPWEQIGDDLPDGDWPFIPAQLAPLASADELGGVRTESIGCAALCSVTPINNDERN